MLLDEIAAYLVAEGLVTDPGSVCKGALPDGPNVPDNIVSLIVMPGEADIYTFGQGQPAVERPRLRVIIRNTDSATAESLGGQVGRSLGSVMDQSLSGTWYDYILKVRGPYQHSPVFDHKRRWLWAIDLKIAKAPS